MKRFLVISFLALALAGGFASVAPVSVPFANAQTTPNTQSNPSQTGAVPAGGDQPTPPGECGAAHLVNCLEQGFAAVIQFIMQLCAWLLGVAALLLDYIVYYTILKMGSYVSSLSAVGVTWRILRDIGNIVLIFGFIAVGISVILDSDWYGGGKKLLPTLIIVAVFLNFSLFISEAIIDVGNLFATELYTQINGGHAPSLVPFSPTSINTEGISNKIMNQLGFVNIFGTANNPKNLRPGNQIGIGFMGIILFIVAAFVFFSLSFILLARFVILLLLIVVAPLGFAGLAVPKLAGTAKSWWSMLINQTLTAPILLLLLYIALKVITDKSFLAELGVCSPSASISQCQNDAATAWSATFNQGNLTSFGGVLLSFLIAMGLLLAVTYMTSKMSAFGGSWATKMGGRLSFGLAAYGLSAPTNAIGRGGRYLTQRYAPNSRAGRFFTKYAFSPAEKARLDLRRLPGVQAGLSLGKASGAGAPIAKAPSERIYQGRDWLKKQGAEKDKQYDEQVSHLEHDLAVKNINKEAAAGALGGDAQKKLASMSTKELETMGGVKNGTSAIIENLSPEQFENLMKSEKLTDIEKGKMVEARYAPLGTAISTKGDVKKVISSMSKADLENLPSGMLRQDSVLAALNDKQREDLSGSKKRTNEERNLIRGASPTAQVKDAFEKAGKGSAGAVAALASPAFGKLTVPQIAKLDKEILTQKEVAEILSPAVLIKLQDEEKLTPDEMTKIGSHIRASTSAKTNPETKKYVTSGPGAALWS